MSIDILTGLPRSGKGMVAAAIALNWMARRRLVCADYFLEGALPWIDWVDCCSPEYAGALFIADEVGSTYAARNTMQLDPLVFAAATMHGKQGTDLLLQAQDYRFVDVQFRRLSRRIGIVRRFGPDGHYAVQAVLQGDSVKHTRTHWWRRPWFFVVQWYTVMDFGAVDGELKATAKPSSTDIYLWTAKRARAYNTQQLVIPAHLRRVFDLAVQNSKKHRVLPAMKRGLIMSPEELADVPPPMQIGRDGRPLTNSAYDVVDLLAARGFYNDGDNWSEHSNPLIQLPKDAIIYVGSQDELPQLSFAERMRILDEQRSRSNGANDGAHRQEGD